MNGRPLVLTSAVLPKAGVVPDFAGDCGRVATQVPDDPPDREIASLTSGLGSVPSGPYNGDLYARAIPFLLGCGKLSLSGSLADRDSPVCGWESGGVLHLRVEMRQN